MINRIYRLTVPAKPKPKQRARGTKVGHHFTPKQTVIAENLIRLCCTQQVGTPMVPGPVAVRVAFFMPAPASMPKHIRGEAAALRSMPLSKPDVDNLCKLVADALNGIAWKDDAHVVDMRALKFYAPPDVAPCTIIEWWQMQPGEVAREGWRLLAGPLALSEASLGLL